VDTIQEALASVSFPPDAVLLIRDQDRRYVAELLKLSEYVDMIIPRGGNTLHTFCRENSTIPVITGGIGICHLATHCRPGRRLELSKTPRCSALRLQRA
jgi:glutamate-5-semialdehyde dehydrogenase